MTITLRDILRQYADTGNLDGKYVPLVEYETLKIDYQWVQTQLIIDGHDPDCACVTASSVDCSCGQREKNEALQAILKRWADKADDGIVDDTFNGVRSPELERLIADTQAAVKGE